MSGYAIIAHNERSKSTKKILKNQYLKKVNKYRTLLHKHKIPFQERECRLENLPCPEYNESPLCIYSRGMPTVKATDFMYRTTQPGDLFTIFEF